MEIKPKFDQNKNNNKKNNRNIKTNSTHKYELFLDPIFKKQKPFLSAQQY